MRKLLVPILKYFGVILIGAVAAYFGLPRTNPVVIDKAVDDILNRAKADSKDAYDAAKRENLEDEILICGRVMPLNAEAFTAKPWPVKRITYSINMTGFTGLKSDDVKEAFRLAWGSYKKVIDIDPVQVESNAMVDIRFDVIDGSGKVLAWSELADGTSTQKHQVYDKNERWELSEIPANIDLVRVAAHEIGHVMGLEHDVPNSGALLAPTYSRTVRYPTERDVRRLIALGYQPAKLDPPLLNPSATIPLTVQINASELIDAFTKAGYKVSK